MKLSSYPILIDTRYDIHKVVRSVQTAGKTVGVVMTMGALHDGHLSLVKACTRQCDVCVVTVFVNPTQFLPGEDWPNYPRRLQADLDILEPLAVDFVFAPTNQEMYDGDHSTFVEPPRISQRWEGECRPGHFRGVCTIVLKLLNCIPADVAYFGRKDYQQCLVIKTMARELSLPTEIRDCPIIRDSDGIALSSRNQYLSAAQRLQALALPRCLAAARNAFVCGERRTDRLVAGMHKVIEKAGILELDYATVVRSEDLQVESHATADSIALVAARLGATRLIDNLKLVDG